MNKHKKILFKRSLSLVLSFLMILPLCTGLLPLVASALEDANDGFPKVSLSWDTDTVSVTDGVATPYKNAGDTPSSYTMSYKISASGNVTEPIDVRVQSFDLSATAGKEYAAVDSKVRLTAETPTVTGTVTVYTHSGYATKVADTGRVYTNEFGIRITEITNAKKQSGADTIRSQVLAPSEYYTLSVSKNSSGGNYGGGTGTFGNGYVYTALMNDYTNKFISSVRVKPDKDQADVPFNPYVYLYSQKNDMPKLLELYSDMKVYYNGTGQITEDSPNKERYGFFIRITENGKIVFEQNQHAKKKWNKWSFNWLTYPYANDGHDHPNANGDFNIINTSVAAYHRTASYGDRYLLQSTKGNVIISLNTCNSDANVSGKDYHDFYFAAMAANNTAVVAQSYNIENRIYGSGDTVYLTVKFNKPVQIENNTAHPLKIQANIGGSLENYFTYCGGNMTDTLVFSMTLPTDRALKSNNIELVGFNNEDYNQNIGDLLWNTSNKNNMWSVVDTQVAGKKFACSIETRTPSITVHDIVGNSGTVKSASFKVSVSNITSGGFIDVIWTNDKTPPSASDPWMSVTFTADVDDRTTVPVEKTGETGTYYAHVRATGISGNKSISTVGPFVFDNQSPSISNIRLTDGDSVQKYLKEHVLLFDISDISTGVDKVYMKAAKHPSGDNGLAGGAEELLIYDSGTVGNLLNITDNTARITVSSSLLDLEADSYGAYKFGFYAIDKLGNQSVVSYFGDALMFDNRNTFSAVIDTTSHISVKGKEIYYNESVLMFSHSEEGSNTWGIASVKYNGVYITASLLENGISGSEGENGKYLLTLDTSVQGYIEIVFKLNGERESNVINFYVTGRDASSPNYEKLYAADRLMINEVWQLSTPSFYSGDNRNGSYYTGTNLRPIFSSREKALEYVKFFEKQDIVIEHIDNEVEKNNLEGGWLSNYRKSEADKDRAVAVGQTWLRYKSNAWTLDSTNEEHWVYYFYSNETVTSIDPNLTAALNDAIERNARLICNYDGDNRIYLTANNTSKNYVNSYSEPYYDARGILTEPLSYRGVFSYELNLSADSGIYDSFITYDGRNVPLVANYKFSIDHLQNGFVYYRQYGTEEWQPLVNGESFKDRLKASGLYEVCEFGNGYMTYLVYIDLDAPVISYGLMVDGESKTGYITSDTSGGALRASKFSVKELLNSIYGGLPVERDRWSYFYVLYNSLGGGEHVFMTMTELNRVGYELSTGIYKIYACDRLGNTVVQTIKINTEDIKLTGTVSSSGLTVTSNRVPTDIMVGTFKVWRDNMLLTNVIYAQSMTFTQSGVYKVEFSDVYGNTVSKEFPFRRNLPIVSFLREKKDGAGIYEQINVNEEDANKLSSVVSDDNQLFTVSTSASIRISYPVSSGYDFEFIGGEPEYKSSIISTTNIDIKSTSKNWTLKIFYANDPDVYILITCVVDKEAPVISGIAFAEEYAYNEQLGAQNNVLFTSTGNTASSIFYNGERAVGNSAIISWTDETRVASVAYTYNGGDKILLNASVGSMTLSKNGRYVFEAEDIFGNKSTFEFTLTDHIDFSLFVGEKETAVNYDPDKYIVGDRYTDTLYTGNETQLVLKENALMAFYFTDGISNTVYNLSYEVKDGRATLLVSAYDSEAGEFAVIENGNIELTSSGTVFSDNTAMKYAYKNGILTLVLPKCEKAYELLQMRVSDFTGHSPVVVQIERSSKVSEMNITREDGTPLDLTYNGFLGSNQKLTLVNSSVSDDTVEIVAFYSAFYTEKFDNAEKTVLYGASATPLLEREGYYKIVATNKYGNERIIYVAVSFNLSLDMRIEYDKADIRVQTLNTPSAYSFFSNKSVEITVWDIRSTVVCYKNGVAFDVNVRSENGRLLLTLTQIGEYTVTVSDECENVYTLTVSLQAPKTLAYDGFITGFNENALKKDQNYTNGALSLDKAKLEASGIKYVAFRKSGEREFTVLYDLIDKSPIEYSEEGFNGSIGKEDGVYEVRFCDVYGNMHAETVYISRKPMLSVERQTQDASRPSAYGFDFTLQNVAWSNYKLTFVNTSEKYLLKINGATESFTDGRYTFTLPANLGVADASHLLSYVDDYGNSYEINIRLYRYVPESAVADGADVVTHNGTLYARSGFSLTFNDGISATYALKGNEPKQFDKNTVFTADGHYTFVFTDYAGNTSTRIIVKDSAVLFDMVSGGVVMPNGAVVSSKVTLSPDEELTFAVTKNGEKYETEARSFAEDGVYAVTLTDSIGNVASFEFTVYAKAKQSFTFNVASGYFFSQIWYITDGHRVSMVSDVVLNENGTQSYNFSTNGAYEIELLHGESNQSCYFTLNIDNAPPEALIIGAENGGATRNTVSIEGLCSGDTIYVYKNGELLKTFIVDGDSETKLDLLGRGDFGSYRTVIVDEAGNTVSYEFTKEFATNLYSNIFICMLITSFGAIGIIYIRFSGKIRTK